MDCLHFTLYGSDNYESFLVKANAVAGSFFTDGRYDLEMEVSPDVETRAFQKSTAILTFWKAEITARRFELDE